MTKCAEKIEEENHSELEIESDVNCLIPDESKEQLNNDHNLVFEQKQAFQLVQKEGLIQDIKRYGKEELWHLITISSPLVISNVANALLGSIDVAFVGHLGQIELAASALGNAYFISLSLVIVGILSAQDTLVSQAEGMKNERTKNIILLRSFFITFIVSIPLLILFMISDRVLLLIGQESETVKLAATFVRLLSIGFPAFVVNNILNRYLIAQSRVLFPMLCGVFSCGVNVLFNSMFVIGIGYKGFGFTGAPIATALTQYFMCVLLIIYTLHLEYKKRKEMSNKIDNVSDTIPSSCLSLLGTIFQRTGIIEYVKLAGPGMLHVCLESWCFTATAFFVGMFGSPQYLAAHTIILSFTNILFNIPLSLGIACSVRVGTCLGSQIPRNAKVCAVLSFLVGVLIMCLNAIQMALLRKYEVSIFTNDNEVIALASSVLPINAVFQIFDGAQTCLSGVLRGTGKQKIGAILIFICFYVIGLPLGLILAFPAHLKLYGIWLGVAVSVFSLAIMELIYLAMRVDFNEQVALALARVSPSDVQQNPGENLDNEMELSNQEDLHAQKSV
jgi:MATE family multidrug resistance protein